MLFSSLKLLSRVYSSTLAKAFSRTLEFDVISCYFMVKAFGNLFLLLNYIRVSQGCSMTISLENYHSFCNLQWDLGHDQIELNFPLTLVLNSSLSSLTLFQSRLAFLHVYLF